MTNPNLGGPDVSQIPAAPIQSPPPVNKLNVLGLVALIVAVVGFIFACVPGALIIGWILLPIAFILSIVSLFMKGKKGFGIAGLILSIVGTIVGVIVFVASLSAAVNDAFGSVTESEVTVTEEVDTAETEGESSGDAGAPEGTRDNPAPIGSTITGNDWVVVVDSYNAAANDIVTADRFNDAPEAGSHYEIVTYTVTYTGDDSGLAAEVGVALVTSGGHVINSYDTFVSLDDGFGMDELYAGASLTGSEGFLVPDGESVLIRVRPGMIADEIFVRP